MVVAADTDVVVRILAADDAGQHRAALARVRKIGEAGGRVLIVSVTLAEAAWVLRARYGYEREQIAAAIDAILHTPPFEVVDSAPAVAALARYRHGPGDLADYLTLELALSAGSERLLTFDRKMLRLSDCEEP